MIKVEEAGRIISGNIKQTGGERITLLEALDRVTARGYSSEDNIPPFDNSAMDGYAVSSSETSGASRENPVLLEVIENLPAGGVAAREVMKGQAARIMTGAPVPRGADAVVVVEKTKSEGRKVRVFEGVKAAENIRHAGEDIKKGDSVIKKGTLITPAGMGLLASIGAQTIEVAGSPRIGILATGDELVDAGQKPGPGKIRNSNSYSLFGLVKKCGGVPVHLGIARDDKSMMREKIEEGLQNDMLIISGGVSVGDYDYVKEVMADLGARIEFEKVAIRPGRPLTFAMIRNKPVFGLPGNPVSVMVCFEVFIRPAISKMLGRDDGEKKEVRAVLEEDVKKRKGLRYFLRAQTRWANGAYVTRTTGPQGSGILRSMALANSLLVLPEDEEAIKKGAKVTAVFLD